MRVHHDYDLTADWWSVRINRFSVRLYWFAEPQRPRRYHWYQDGARCRGWRRWRIGAQANWWGWKPRFPRREPISTLTERRGERL